MSCQGILSLLSTYIDGEAQAHADEIEEHLATCASCARELELLRQAAGMLRAAAEIEPPAFLLERIEATTVRRPAFWARLRGTLAAPRLMPQYARWTAAGAAAVGVLIGILVLQPNPKQSVHAPTLAVRPSPSKSVAGRPANTGVQVEVGAAAFAQAGPTAGWRARIGHEKTHRWHAMTAKAPRSRDAGSKKLTAKHGSPAESGSPVKPEAESPAGATLVAETVKPADDLAAKEPTPKAEEIRVAAFRSNLEARLKQQAEAFEKLRAQMAARNEERKRLSSPEFVEGRRYSVELASIWF